MIPLDRAAGALCGKLPGSLAYSKTGDSASKSFSSPASTTSELRVMGDVSDILGARTGYARLEC